MIQNDKFITADINNNACVDFTVSKNSSADAFHLFVFKDIVREVDDFGNNFEIKVSKNGGSIFVSEEEVTDLIEIANISYQEQDKAYIVYLRNKVDDEIYVRFILKCGTIKSGIIAKSIYEHSPILASDASNLLH